MCIEAGHGIFIQECVVRQKEGEKCFQRQRLSVLGW